MSMVSRKIPAREYIYCDIIAYAHPFEATMSLVSSLLLPGKGA
jgi:hypothetical protein